MSAEQQQLSTGVEGGMTEACPDCGSAKSIYHRRTKEPAWVCWECNTEFDEPERRPSQGNRYNLPPSQRTLLNADPEDWP